MSRHLLLLGLVLLSGPHQSQPPAGIETHQSRPAPVIDAGDAQARAGGRLWRGRKPLHQLLGCFVAILGVGGLLLVLATGPSVAVLGVLVVGLALEICG